MKTRERAKVRELRRTKGLSVRELAETVGVSKSSVSLWVRDVQLTGEQLADLHRRNPAYNGQHKGAKTIARAASARRTAYQDEGRRRVRRGDEAFVRCCLLYWAEGWKTRHALSYSNADPEMIRYWVHLLRTALGVADERMRVGCHLFSDHVSRQLEVENFWLDITRLDRKNLHRSIVNNYSRSSQRKRRRMLPYGTCKVVVCDTHRAQMVLGGIQEIGGFTRPEWLE